MFQKECRGRRGTCPGLPGQASTEFLLILASSLVVLAAVIIVSQQQATAIVDVNAQTQARNAAQDLAAGAREVYSQGTGARKQVFIQLPSSYSPSGSRIVNRSIQVRAAGSDYVTSTEFDIQGSLPTSPGGHQVWLVSEGSRVRIGIGLLSIDRPALSVVMDRDSSRSELITIRNVFDNTVNVTLARLWTPDAVSLALDASSFSLGPGQSRVVQVSLTSNENAVGFYNGYLSIQGISDGISETQTLPVTVEVVLPPSATRLTIVPSTWDVTTTPGNSTSATFAVCTGSTTTVPGVTFSTTAGAAGAWIGNLSSLPAMSASTCLDKTFSLSVPANATLGIYGGAIFASGGTDIEDTVDLTVYAVQPTNDTIGPLVYNISRIPIPTYPGNALTIFAAGDDRTTGNSPIAGCQLNVDGGSWRTMDATDGAYGSALEAVSLGIGSFAGGTHTIGLRCTDVAGNTGPVANYSFSLTRTILLLTQDNGGGTPASDWASWLSTHTSGEGFSWAYDRYQRQDFVAGLVNASLYRMVLVPEDITNNNPNDAVTLLLGAYTAAGGIVVFVDRAAEHGFEDLGFSTGHSSTNRRYTYVSDNASYATSGLALGYLNIYPTDTSMWLQRGFNGIVWTTSESDQVYPAMAQSSNGYYVAWGVTNPNSFLSAGHNLTRRVVDFALLSSTIGN